MAKIIQFTGLSGAGKSTIAQEFERLSKDLRVKIIDGDVYRQSLCKDLGFSKADRIENIKRLGQYAKSIENDFDVIIIAAINPFNESRDYLKASYHAALIYITCQINVLVLRDTKGLYKRALLPDEDPDKLHNLTGVNDIFEEPESADLIINTTAQSLSNSVKQLTHFVYSVLE
ncbi:adenylyl-sulfate kinase [Pedobacter rhizosphaerae]|uniref:Adenylyl-sulfate kinase n=1 Tax=Pedobacter rhizosphaerae TaxID=390241 RepID=A0A1H9TWZ8_9SPHI|nr:adenylyl-sulfate kinase [Pedobacter rhizosphaerae]SES01293.1 adenylylsulfate kinase [Pedobacter rhizosphaerae]